MALADKQQYVDLVTLIIDLLQNGCRLWYFTFSILLPGPYTAFCLEFMTHFLSKHYVAVWFDPIFCSQVASDTGHLSKHFRLSNTCCSRVTVRHETCTRTDGWDAIRNAASYKEGRIKIIAYWPFNNRYTLLCLFEFRAVTQHCNSCQSHPCRRVSVVCSTWNFQN